MSKTIDHTQPPSDVQLRMLGDRLDQHRGMLFDIRLNIELIETGPDEPGRDGAVKDLRQQELRQAHAVDIILKRIAALDAAQTT